MRCDVKVHGTVTINVNGGIYQRFEWRVELVYPLDIKSKLLYEDLSNSFIVWK